MYYQQNSYPNGQPPYPEQNYGQQPLLAQPYQQVGGQQQYYPPLHGQQQYNAPPQPYGQVQYGQPALNQSEYNGASNDQKNQLPSSQQPAWSALIPKKEDRFKSTGLNVCHSLI
jgi:hypothetical protein